MSGNGAFVIRDGKLQNLPALAVLFLNPFKAFADRVVDKVDAKFRIQGDRFIVDRFEDLRMRSDALEIQALGWIDFNQTLSLLCVPQAIDIPLWEDFWEGLSRFTLTGPLEKPEYSPAPLQGSPPPPD